MENKIDQFFKDKLDSHTLPPAEETWAKVEANLSKKNNVAVWRIAAAVLIAGALVSVIIWSQRSVDKNQPVIAAKKSPKDNSITEKPATQISKEKKEEVKSNNKKSSITLPQSISPKPDNILNQQKVEEIDLTPVAVLETKEQAVAVAQENSKEEKINSKATSPTTIASTKQKPIKLEFTLDDFSSEQPVATASEEKSSGLKKVWDLAREVKNGDGPVHEIKNELFALNFKKNKNQ